MCRWTFQSSRKVCQIRKEVMPMARKKQTDNQFSFDDYQLKQVDVRLKLMDGPSYYSKTPILNASDAVDVMRDVLKELDREWVCVVNLDNHLKYY